MTLGAASAVATGAGNAPIWVAALGVVSVIFGALIPELFRLMKPRSVEAVAPPPVSADAFQALSDKVTAVVITMGNVEGQLRGVRREQRVVREALETRDREHLRELEGVRDQLQRHLWADHGFDRRRADTGPNPLIPPPRTEPV